jgi:signal transduction histidine kinase
MENAIASTPSGGRIDVRVFEDGGRCHIEIEDGGFAVSADDAANLSKPLWRSPDSAKTRAGLGLGLAVAHHVLTKHGGSLSVSSGTVGARFELTLPLAAAEPPLVALQRDARAGDP